MMYKRKVSLVLTRSWIILAVSITTSCVSPSTDSSVTDPVATRDLPFSLSSKPGERIRTAGFVVLDAVFNSELMAPYDVLQHSIFRDKTDYIQPFIVAQTMDPVRTFEGIDLLPHFTFETAPPLDILVIPSTDNSMTVDLENESFMSWLAEAIDHAEYVVTLCDGAFPLAHSGALDGRVATTFPGDRERFASMYPEVDVRFDVRIVHDGKFLTSVGGGMSYEPAFYLVEQLYGREHAQKTAEGLVWDWDLDSVPVWSRDS